MYLIANCQLATANSFLKGLSLARRNRVSDWLKAYLISFLFFSIACAIAMRMLSIVRKTIS